MIASFSPDSLSYIGVTGTNGKTSCTWWLAQLLRDFGKRPGLIGTLGCGVWSSDKPVVMQETGYTTPDAKLLQKILAEFVQQGATHVVMEVSSHGLEQGRVKGVKFSTALFTNLSRDHLDYHGTMEKYGAAKARLFQVSGLKNAVVNVDDPFGRTLAAEIKTATVIRYSISDASADVYLRDLHIDAEGVRGNLVSPWGQAKIFSPVIGEFNVSNLLGVISVLCAEGFALSSVADAIGNLQSPPGRLQRVSVDKQNEAIQVFVDFAHSPDALEKILTTLKPQTKNKLWCVFGCGGDRDVGKRPVMGAVASRLADHVIVTSDNPRSENPRDIIDQILVGMDLHKTTAIEDRKSAIVHAICQANVGDVVLIAGKGHETYQEIKGTKIPFSDVSEASSALRLRANKGGYA